MNNIWGKFVNGFEEVVASKKTNSKGPRSSRAATIPKVATFDASADLNILRIHRPQCMFLLSGENF